MIVAFAEIVTAEMVDYPGPVNQPGFIKFILFGVSRLYFSDKQVMIAGRGLLDELAFQVADTFFHHRGG